MAENLVKYDGFTSEHFGVEIGNLSPKGLSLELTEVRRALLEAQEAGIQMVMTRLSPNEVDKISLVEALGGQAFDTLITSTLYPVRGPETTLFPIEGVTIESCDQVTNEGDISAIRDIGETAFNLTHLHNDPRLSKDGWRSFYRASAGNSATERAKRVILARNDQGKVVGFTTLYKYKDEETLLGVKDLGVIYYTAVSEEYRRRRVATRMIDESNRWFAENVDLATVGTEDNNFWAYRTYKGCGYRLGLGLSTGVLYSYHIWLDEALR